MTQFVEIKCFKCGCVFGMTTQFYQVAQQRGESMGWFCPNGHEQVFTNRPSEADKLRAERDRLKQQTARLIEEAAESQRVAEAERRRAAAARGQVTKLKKRAAAGVCPCCNRTFQDLARHMSGQHPEFMTQPVEGEHVH